MPQEGGVCVARGDTFPDSEFTHVWDPARAQYAQPGSSAVSGERQGTVACNNKGVIFPVFTVLLPVQWSGIF